MGRYAYSPSCHGSRARRPKRSRHRRATPEPARGSGSGGSSPGESSDASHMTSSTTGTPARRAASFIEPIPDRPLARTIPTYRPIPLAASGTEPPAGTRDRTARRGRRGRPSSITFRRWRPPVPASCPASCSRGAFGGRDATVSSHAGSSPGPPPAIPTSCGLPPTTIGPWAGRTILRRPSSRSRRGDPNRRPC